jgi:hypothetical protein
LNLPLHVGDERLPLVRARLFLLVRSLRKRGVLQAPHHIGERMAPALHLLPELWARLRVEILGEELLAEILPGVERCLASGGEVTRVEGGLSARGPVDWHQTWRRQLERGEQTLLVTRHWKRKLDLPENRLLFHALQEVADGAERALRAPIFPEEAAPLRAIEERARYALRRPPWRDMESGDRDSIRRAAQRVQRLPGRPAYAALLRWWDEWQFLQETVPGTAPLAEPALEPDWLFELLLLFELVNALAAHLPVRQCRALYQDSRLPAFVARAPGGGLEIFYQSGSMLAEQRSLADIRAIPDIILRLPGPEPSYVILDAKNYVSSGHTQALYKMLGYLYQFGYSGTGHHHFHRVRAGIIAFPTLEREGHGLRHWQRDLPGAQMVSSFVLPPLPDPRFTGLQELVQWLISAV